MKTILFRIIKNNANVKINISKTTYLKKKIKFFPLPLIVGILVFCKKKQVGCK
jgi:hypothetical protein